MAWSFYPKNTLPKALDIVWCRFPIVEDPKNPGPKQRPGLVRRALVKDDHGYVEVCYGTSKFRNYSDRDLIIGNLADLYEMFLPQATVFQLDRCATIPWASEWFGDLDGRGPSISRLTPKYCEYVAHLTKRGRG